MILLNGSIIKKARTNQKNDDDKFQYVITIAP